MTGEEYGELFRQACDLFENNELDKAEEICNILIEVNDKQAPIYNLLSLIKDKKGDIEQAILNSERAILLKENDYIYYSNLGNYFKKNLSFDKALIVLEKSIELNPNFHISNFNLANVHKIMGNLREAQRYFEKAIEIKPDYVEAMNNLGLLFMESHNFILAEQYYLKALNYSPSDLDIIYNLSLSLIYLRKNEEAEYFLKKTIDLDNNHILAHRFLGNILVERGNIDEAKVIYQKFLDLIKNKDEIVKTVEKLYISTVTSYLFDSNNDIDIYRQKLYDLTKNKYSYSDFYFMHQVHTAYLHFNCNNTYSGRDDKEIKIRWYEMFKENFPEYTLTSSKGKIKIAFLVSKFNERVFIKFMSDILNSLESTTFDIYIICDKVGWESLLKLKFKSDISPIFLNDNLLTSAEIIKDFNLDIIYYWEIGTDSTNYFLPFFRLANIQCTSIGWPDTTGIKTVDYFISSNLIEKEDSQEHYSEKLIKINKLPLYFSKPKIDNYKDLEYFNLNNNSNIYFYCHNVIKTHPDFDYIVSNILSKDSKSIIIFYRPNNSNEGIYKRLKKRLRKSIIEDHIFNRVIFLDNLSFQDYLNLIKNSSVILDSLYFGGISTAYDCFAMEVPVVTYPWSHARGRYTLGCYKQMGIEGLVANSLDEYVDLAIKTATDKEFRDKIVRDIRENNYKLYEDKELFEEYNNLFKRLFNLKQREIY